jgi:hypothetical protein
MFEQIANHDFGALSPQRCASLVFPVYERPNSMPAPEEMSNGVGAGFAGGPSDEVFPLLHGGFSGLWVSEVVKSAGEYIPRCSMSP